MRRQRTRQATSPVNNDVCVVQDEISIYQAIVLQPCAVIIRICLCLTCVFLTWTIAFFAPEIGEVWFHTVPRNGASHHQIFSQGADWKRRPVDAQRCAQRCLHDGRGGGIFLLQLDYDGESSRTSPLRGLLHSSIGCEPPDAGAEKKTLRGSGRAGTAQQALYVQTGSSPFDHRVLQHKGLVFIAEWRSHPSAPIGVERPVVSLHGSDQKVKDNSIMRVLANIPDHAPFVKNAAAYELALATLQSFDLVLLGEWESDTNQRSRLEALLQSPSIRTFNLQALSAGEQSSPKTAENDGGNLIGGPAKSFDHRLFDQMANHTNDLLDINDPASHGKGSDAACAEDKNTCRTFNRQRPAYFTKHLEC